METTPAMKAGRIIHALLDGQNVDTETIEEIVCDALTDLKHACDMFDLDFEVCSRIAHNHYLKELN